jgi:sugar (pentulose or hexulose) kinase
MKETYRVLAFDCGSSNGRILAGDFDGKTLKLSELNRFPNYPQEMGDVHYWNVMQIWQNVKLGLKSAAAQGSFHSISTDSWGGDLALLRPDGQMLQNVVSYRDNSMKKSMDKANSYFSSHDLYKKIGSHYFLSSTVAVLVKIREEYPSILDAAKSFLNICDYFNFLLSGVMNCEFTIASTSQMIDPRTGQWHWDVIKTLGLPEKIFLPPVLSGNTLGSLRTSLAEELGMSGVKVIAACGHDSAAAIAAVPALSADPWMCISSGSWSILMYETGKTYLDVSGYHGFMHEGCYGGKTRITYNQAGLWLIQELRRAFGNPSFDSMDAQAGQVEAFRSIIIPQHYKQMFIPNLPDSMREYCKKTGQPIPETLGELVRCAYDSIAINSAIVIGKMEKMTGVEFKKIHVVGGGTYNAILLQNIADITGKELVAGPKEPAVTGNMLVQLIAQGELANLTQARQLVLDSFKVSSYYPAKNARLPDMEHYTREMYDKIEKR